MPKSSQVGFAKPGQSLSRSRHRPWCKTPGDANPRREIMVVPNVGLRFITEPETQRQRRIDFPIITHKGSDIELAQGEQWIAGVDAELTCPTTQIRNLRRRESKFLE